MTAQDDNLKDTPIDSGEASHMLGEDIKARLPDMHKGDVGGPNPANEQVYQGSKQTEFNPPSNPRPRE